MCVCFRVLRRWGKNLYTTHSNIVLLFPHICVEIRKTCLHLGHLAPCFEVVISHFGEVLAMSCGFCRVEFHRFLMKNMLHSASCCHV